MSISSTQRQVLCPFGTNIPAPFPSPHPLSPLPHHILAHSNTTPHYTCKVICCFSEPESSHFNFSFLVNKYLWEQVFGCGLCLIWGWGVSFNMSYFGFFCCRKHSDWGQLKEERFLFWFGLTAHSLAGREVRTGTQSRNLETGIEAKTMKGCCSLACSPWPCSAGFLTEPRTTRPGMASPIVHRGTIINHSSITNQEHALTDLPGGSPSLKFPSFQMTLVCVKLTKN